MLASKLSAPLGYDVDVTLAPTLPRSQAPVQYLKIDQSLVKGLHEDSIDKALLEAFHRVGTALGMRTVAEGVEDAAALAAVIAVGVDFAQGFHLGRPGPLTAYFSELAATTER